MTPEETIGHAIESLRVTQAGINDALRGLNPGIWHSAIGANLQLWRALLAQECLADPRRLERHGLKCYSQNDEDGILVEIFKRLSIEPATFIEFGVGNGLENNTLLWLKGGARGLWIEADPASGAHIQNAFAAQLESGALQLRHARVTPESIDAEFNAAGISGDIDLLSIDIDGNDYYVFDAIRAVTPKVVVIEYNAKFPPPIRFRIPYNPDFRWDGTDWFGASLQSFEELFHRRGYGLVACNITGSNAFFVRSDVLDERLFMPPFTAANHYHPARYFLTTGLFNHLGGHRPDPRPGAPNP